MTSWLAVAVAVASVVCAVALPQHLESAASATTATAPERRPPSRASAESLAAAIVAGDVFRTERRAATISYDPAREGDAAEDAPERPVLRLRGVVLGDGARALVEGLPGVTGARLLAAGESWGGLRVLAVTPRGARITGMDTTWTLTLERRP